MKARVYALFALCIMCVLPLSASAHEVYVLTKAEIATGIATPAFSSFAEITSHVSEFAFWTFISIFVVFLVFAISISRRLEDYLDPLLRKGRKYAKAIPRVVVGISFIAASYFGGIFGPELPQKMIFGSFAPAVGVLLAILGVLLILHKYTRTVAVIAGFLYLCAVHSVGWYMLTYANYAGEIIVLLLISSHPRTQSAFGSLYARMSHALAPYYFLIIRVTFGISLLFASLYAKFIHNDLALQVATLPLAGHTVGLATHFGLEPHFLVLGAGIIEIVIALFFIFGIEIRFTSLFLEFWLSLSLIYFGEVVWPHLILIGIPIAFMLYGYDKTSLEGYFFKKGNREPIL